MLYQAIIWVLAFQILDTSSAYPLSSKNELDKRVSNPVSQPSPGSWFGPENYKSKDDFMIAEVHKAYLNPASRLDLKRLPELPSAKWVAWGDHVQTIALAGLWGCTAVIAVSERGVWIAHYWQYKGNLVRDSLGNSTDGPANILNQGLGRFRYMNGVPHGNMFDDDAEPQVYIVTSMGERYVTNKTAEPPAYVTSDLYKVVPHFPSTVYPVLPIVRSALDAWWRRGKQGPTWEVVYREMFPNGDDPKYLTQRGKVMVQYQPAIGCIGSCPMNQTVARRAEYRVWFEGNILPGGDKSWIPDGNNQTIYPHQR